jgi:hypothetical protein
MAYTKLCGSLYFHPIDRPYYRVYCKCILHCIGEGLKMKVFFETKMTHIGDVVAIYDLLYIVHSINNEGQSYKQSYNLWSLSGAKDLYDVAERQMQILQVAPDDKEKGCDFDDIVVFPKRRLYWNCPIGKRQTRNRTLRERNLPRPPHSGCAAVRHYVQGSSASARSFCATLERRREARNQKDEKRNRNHGSRLSLNLKNRTKKQIERVICEEYERK